MSQHQDEKNRDVTLQRLASGDLALIDRMLDCLQDYAMRIDGVAKTSEGAHRLLTAVPPGCAEETKHVFAVRRGDEAVGLVDLIDGYPEVGTAFVGLLAIVETHHGQGLGRAALRAAEDFARDALGAAKLRLAVVSTNDVLGFWRKMGFVETGEVRPYAGAHVSGEARLLEKAIKACGE